MITFLRQAGFFFFIGCSYLGASDGIFSYGQEEQSLNGNYHEIRFGILAHDLNSSFTHGHEKGMSLNIEYLFASPQTSFFETIFSPHPHIGCSLNTEHSTSMLYAGFTWEILFQMNWFANVIFGGALHNGSTKKDTKHRKNFGARFLFHSGISLGYIFYERHTLSLMVDHISNAKLAKPNPGFTDFGIRYGYRF